MKGVTSKSVGRLLYALMVLQASTCSTGAPPVERQPALGSSPQVSVAQLDAAYEGYLDAVGCEGVTGWAWDKSRPDTTVDVEIFDGSTHLARIAASQLRADLLDGGKGNGVHAFSYGVPMLLKDGRRHSIHVKISGTNMALTGSPKELRCASQ